MTNNSPFLTYGPIRLLNIPGMDVLAEECITQDVYQIKNLKGKWSVADIGACYGEFSFFATSLGHMVHAYEPSPDSKLILDFNNRINTPLRFRDNTMVKGDQKLRSAIHYYRPHHPAGSGPDCGDGIPVERRVVPMADVVLGLLELYGDNVFVKLDCEGAEVEIFDHIDTWIDGVQAVSMETHNHDADVLGKKLSDRGFTVELFGTCPYPLPKWDKSMTAGLVIARK